MPIITTADRKHGNYRKRYFRPWVLKDNMTANSKDSALGSLLNDGVNRHNYYFQLNRIYAFYDFFLFTTYTLANERTFPDLGQPREKCPFFRKFHNWSFYPRGYFLRMNFSHFRDLTIFFLIFSKQNSLSFTSDSNVPDSGSHIGRASP